MHLFQLLHKPAYQALLFVLLTIVLAVVVRPKNAEKVWVLCGVVYCLFIATNSALSFWAVEVWSYFFLSLGFTIVYLFAIAIIVKVIIKALKLAGSEESAMVFLVVIFHPIALLLVLLLKWAF